MSSDRHGADDADPPPTTQGMPTRPGVGVRGTYDRRGAILAGAGVVAGCVAVVVGLGRDPGTAPNPRAWAPGWREVFFDDFSGPELDPTAWSRYSGRRAGNLGLRDPAQVAVANGELRIVALGDVSGGLAHRQNHVYGRWEVRARVDAGQGYGPAILLWPQSDEWPDDGEIDISEVPEGARRRSHFTVHWGAGNSQAGVSSVGDFTRWHVFGCEWHPDVIRYLLDGEPQWELRSPRAAIPHKPMHLAIQLDVGGDGHWIPARDVSTPQPVVLHVDWVRVLRRM
jgi:beta-glucanase (GH16 family)